MNVTVPRVADGTSTAARTLEREGVTTVDQLDWLGTGFGVGVGVGVGVGLRWKSPAGPLALDLARGRARERRDAQWQVHFSLMVAF